MFTKAWYNSQAVKLTRLDNTVEYTAVDGSTKRKFVLSYCPILYYLLQNTDMANYPCVSKARKSYAEYGGVVFGDGSATPKMDDYKMSGNLFSTFNYSAGWECKVEDNAATVDVTFTITNSGSEAFTIREIGLISNSNSNKQDLNYKVLLERTLLDNPVTIEPGGVGQVVYTIRMDFPTA